MLVVTIAATTDECDFLVAALGKAAEMAPPNSAERFWLERISNRVNQAMIDVVAGDSAARLAASSAPGFPMAPPPPPAPPPLSAGLCTCGNLSRSSRCLQRTQNGTHP